MVIVKPPAIPKTTRELIDKALQLLSPREEQVLRVRWGWDKEPMTLREVGERFAVTGERIRQIQSKALTKLRALLGRRAFKLKRTR